MPRPRPRLRLVSDALRYGMTEQVGDCMYVSLPKIHARNAKASSWSAQRSNLHHGLLRSMAGSPVMRCMTDMHVVPACLLCRSHQLAATTAAWPILWHHHRA